MGLVQPATLTGVPAGEVAQQRVHRDAVLRCRQALGSPRSGGARGGRREPPRTTVGSWYLEDPLAALSAGWFWPSPCFATLGWWGLPGGETGVGHQVAVHLLLLSVDCDGSHRPRPSGTP